MGILVTVGVGLLYYFLGNQFEDSKEQLIRTVDSKMIDYRIVETFRMRLEEVIAITLDNERTRKEIDSKVDESAKAAIDRKIAEVERIIREEVPQDIIERASLPRGAVVAFNSNTCPSGWREYSRAYGRFIRGIDKADSGIDPDGRREVGSIQNEQFLAHTHTRPRGVYDAGGGSDAPIGELIFFDRVLPAPWPGEFIHSAVASPGFASRMRRCRYGKVLTMHRSPP